MGIVAHPKPKSTPFGLSLQYYCWLPPPPLLSPLVDVGLETCQKSLKVTCEQKVWLPNGNIQKHARFLSVASARCVASVSAWADHTDTSRAPFAKRKGARDLEWAVQSWMNVCMRPQAQIGHLLPPPPPLGLETCQKSLKVTCEQKVWLPNGNIQKHARFLSVASARCVASVSAWADHTDTSRAPFAKRKGARDLEWAVQSYIYHHFNLKTAKICS